MAEIAVAVAIAVFNEALGFLRDANPRAHPDLETIKIWLTTMKAYLKDAEGKEGTEGLKNRLQQVRDVAYDIEDIIEEFMLQVPEHVHEHKVTRFLHDVVHSIKDRAPLHKLESGIENIKSKIHNIGEMDQFRANSVESASTSGAGQVAQVRYPILKEDELVGIEKRRDELLNLIMGGGSRLAVFSVVGSSGSGKTTLMKEVYERMKEEFQCYAYIPVQHPCRGMPKKIFTAMELPVSQATDMEEKLHSYLKDKKYIFCFDGIRSKEDWKYISDLLPDGYHGSRIIISTVQNDIASHCVRHSDNVYHLGPLTWEEGWELFCKKAFGLRKCPKHLIEGSEMIVKRCEGLPLAIVAVGNLLSTKQQNPSEFKKLHESLGHELGANSDLSVVGRILLQSYCHLSYNLRCCFLFFGHFPEDKSVSRGRLIRLWIAEHFIEASRGKTLEQVAEEYLEELIAMRLVEVSRRDFEGNVRSCRVQNLVREFIISKSEKEKFCKVFSSSYGSSGEKTRRLSLNDVSTNSFKGDEFSAVRTLMMFGRKRIPGSPDRKLINKLGGIEKLLHDFESESFKNFRLLRILDLEDADLKSFPKEIISLSLLRYLSLRNTEVKTIPGSIKRLRNLVTLDLRQTLIMKLPKEILELQKLLYLLVGLRDENESCAGVEMVQSVGRLKLLHKLSLIKASSKGIVKELGCLTELRKLGISELKREDGNDLYTSIINMENLSSLCVISTSKEGFLDLDHGKSLPRLIRSLHLAGRLQNIPQWIGSLDSLSTVRLQWSRLSSSPLAALHHLPCLVELQLINAYIGEELVFQAGWFMKLKMLKIEQFSRLHTVVVRRGAIPDLQRLVFRKCESLKIAPLGINLLTKLEELHVLDMPQFQSLS